MSEEQRALDPALEHAADLAAWSDAILALPVELEPPPPLWDREFEVGNLCVRRWTDASGELHEDVTLLRPISREAFEALRETMEKGKVA